MRCRAIYISKTFDVIYTGERMFEIRSVWESSGHKTLLMVCVVTACISLKARISFLFETLV